MNRQILFRGLTASNEWVEGSPVYYFESRHVSQGYDDVPPRVWQIFDFNGSIHEVKPESIGQFCGLHDKHGKRIFEWDVVQHDAWDYPFVVFFDTEKARFVCKLKTGLTLSIDPQNISLVGNIHTNPELLQP